MYTEWSDSDADDNVKLIARTEEHPEVVVLNTTICGAVDEYFCAMQQLCHDELGDPKAIYSSGEVFEIVAVPDDVSFKCPDTDSITVEYGECVPVETVRETERALDQLGYENSDPDDCPVAHHPAKPRAW